MQVVYFGRELYTRSLGWMGAYCVEPEGRWVSPEEIDAVLTSGEIVAIRPASASEMRRAEQAVILLDIFGQMRDAIGNILDQKQPEEVEKVLGDLAAAIIGADPLPTNTLFDSHQ